MITLLVLVLVVGVAAAWGVGIYNGLVTARNAYKNAFAQIDVQLTRRYDLIPNLVEVAKGYLKHERETLEAVIQARAAAVSGLAAAKANPGDPAAMAALGGAESGLAGALSHGDEPAQRQALLTGVLFAPMLVSEVLQGAAEATQGQAEFALFDAV